MFGHVCLCMCLLPTWMYFWACLQGLLIFFLEILSQVGFLSSLWQIQILIGSQKFIASMDWSLIHPRTLSNVGISSKLSNACTRAYKCVWLPASCCLIHFPKTEREEMTTQTEEIERRLHFNRKTNREGVSIAVGVTVTGERRRHGEGKTETQRRRRREEDADKQEMWLTWMCRWERRRKKELDREGEWQRETPWWKRVVSARDRD